MTHGILTFARFSLIVCTVAMLVVTYCCVRLAVRAMGEGDADDALFHIMFSVAGVLTTILCVAMMLGLYGMGD